MWINHDHDLVDVGLHETTTGSTSTTTPTATASRAGGTSVRPATTTTCPPTRASRLSHTLRSVTAAIAVALAITLGNAAPAQAAPATATTTTPSSPTPTETIHTTATHPWLTADRGWVDARLVRTVAQGIAALPRNPLGNPDASQRLRQWLQQAHSSGVPELTVFAATLGQDHEAAAAALALGGRQGHTEELITTLQRLKRTMSGRAQVAVALYTAC